MSSSKAKRPHIIHCLDAECAITTSHSTTRLLTCVDIKLEYFCIEIDARKAR